MPSVERERALVAPAATIAFGIVVACFLLLVGRLWFLQVLRADYFRMLAENNRIRTVFLPPPRGLILDRKGQVLAKNRPSFNVELVVGDSPEPRQSVEALARLLKVDFEELWARMKDQRRRRFEPKLLLKDVSRDAVALVMANRYRLPGIFISVTPTREYVRPEHAVHLLGYIREISSQQLEDPSYVGYHFGDLVGKAGVEARNEEALRGKRGAREVVVNAAGMRIGESSYKAEVSGHNVQLSIDAEVQQAADDALKDKKGAIVAMDPRNGELLAMSSSPRFDPNLFTREIPSDVWKDLTQGREHRLTNRALQGAYPPGSVFKVFMAVAGLAEGVMRPDERVNCPGGYQVGRRYFRCHKKGGHGSVGLREAVAQSCDVYFYVLGQRLGVDRIHEYATRFGLGRLTGIELEHERPGLIPSTAWKRRAFKREQDKKWYPGETPSVVIGQGAVTTTPLQLTRSIAALINGGKVLKPLVRGHVSSAQGDFIWPGEKVEVQGEVGVDPRILEMIKSTMVSVVEEPRGTGGRARLGKTFPYKVGGKTGTAQVVALDLLKKGTHLDDHAWFSGYAPADNPMIVVTALVENGGHGGAAAAPLVKQVLEAYFRSVGMEKPELAQPAASPSPRASPSPKGSPTA
jgi:penicillin-binding protein 2